MGIRSIVLVDGEHYPPVLRRAIEELRRRGEDPVLALLVGGGEKLGQSELDLGIEVRVASDPEVDLANALDETSCARVLDLSDEPVLGYVARHRMASVALWKGAAYVGPDFEFTPPRRPRILTMPSIAIIGTGKRCGKTAVASGLARALDEAQLHPVIVAMGRGGPAEPELIDGSTSLSSADLLRMVTEGRHAASDHIEDALTAGVPTVGSWRAGGGLAGAIACGNFDAAVKVASELDPGILIAEGSGAAIPPVATDAGVLVIPAWIDPANLCGYFGLFRVLQADLVVLTMCEESLDPEHLAAVESCIARSPLNRPQTVRTALRPHPLADISGKRIWFATTAPPKARDMLKQHLQQNYKAESVTISHALADRQQLNLDIKAAEGADVILTELKAAAVDVVTRFGLEHGIDVVYADTRIFKATEEEPDSADAFLEIAAKAKARFGKSTEQ